MNRRLCSPAPVLGAIVLLCSLLLADVGHAYDPTQSNVRYPRKTREVEVEADLLASKLSAYETELDEQREREDQLGEDDGHQAKTGPRPHVPIDMREQQIVLLTELIETTDEDDPEYPDFLFRLADEHIEVRKHHQLQADSRSWKIYEAEDDHDHDARALQIQLRDKDLERARASARQAVDVYAALVENPKLAAYKRLDESLLWYAVELGYLREEQRMRDALARLVADFPRSPLVANAYYTEADYDYEVGNYADAVALFERVLDFDTHPAYGHALYMLGRSHLQSIGGKPPRYEDSLDAFLRTITATKEGRAGSEARGKQLRRDARRTLVRAYAHAREAADAWALFQDIGDGPAKDEQHARMMMELLAREYVRAGRHADSTIIYEQLQAAYPNHADSCEWQAQIVLNTYASPDPELQLREAEALPAELAKLVASKGSKSRQKKCRAAAHDALRDLAEVWHHEANARQDLHTFELAARAYQAYLAAFAREPDSYELRYFYAELLWDKAELGYNSKDRDERRQGAADFHAAHEQFVALINLDREGKYTVDAANAQMLAMQNYLEYDDTRGRQKSCRPTYYGLCDLRKSYQAEVSAAERFPESAYEGDALEILASYDLYAEIITRPIDEQLARIRYHRAKLAMEHNRFDEAKPLLIEIIEAHGDRSDKLHYASWSAQMLVDLLVIRWVDPTNDRARSVATTDELERWLTRLQTMKLWSHEDSDDLRDDADHLLAGVGWRRAVDHRRAGEAWVAGEADGDARGFERCAAAFVDVFNEFEYHEQADTLLGRAAECADRAQLTGQAIQLREALIDRFPYSWDIKQELLLLAGSYEKVARHDDAARRYEDFVEDWQKDPRAPDMLENAYLLRLGLGQADEAARDLAKYESLYKKREPQKAARVFWTRHDLLDTDAARREHALAYLDGYARTGGLDRAVVAEAVIAQIDWRASCPEPLLHDACVTMTRTQAYSGSAAIETRRIRELDMGLVEHVEAHGYEVKPVLPSRCGRPSQAVLTVHVRDTKLAAAAQARLARILKRIGNGRRIEIPAEEQRRARAFEDAWAMARVYRADERYEAYLGQPLPAGLDFWKAEWLRGSGIPSWERKYRRQAAAAAEAHERLRVFLIRQRRVRDELLQRYAAVAELGSPHGSLVAAARSASLVQHAADQLARAEVPDGFTSAEQYWEYCDTLEDLARPLVAEASAAWQACIARSSELGFVSEFSRLCELELQQIDAQRHPATNELLGAPVHSTSELVSAEVLEDPDGRRPNPLQRRAGHGE